MSAALHTLQALKEKIRAIEHRAVEPLRLLTGVPEIDDLVAGLPSPGLVELAGAPGSGRTRVITAVAARLAARGRVVAWIDPARRVHPPGLAAQGVELSNVLLVRPPADQDVWACEQAVRSGCFPLVVVVDPPLRKHLGARLSRAAEQGACSVVVLSERSQREIPANIRLLVQRDQLVVVRDRAGAPGRVGRLPRSLP